MSKASKLRLKIEGDLPNIFEKLGIISLISLTMIPLLYVYFLYVDDVIFINDYREILRTALGSELNVSQLPKIDNLDLPYGEIIQLVALQMILIVGLWVRA